MIGLCARVLRPPVPDINLPRCWYVCDLKVHPDYRGQRTPLRIARAVFASSYARCGRGYAITMDPADAENRVVRLVQRLRLVPSLKVLRLSFFSLDADQMTEAASLVEAHRGPVSYLSLGGIKDIVLESTGAPMKLLHVQFGPRAEGRLRTPVAGATHMFCAPVDDPLEKAMLDQGFSTSATASMLQHRLPAAAARWILTSGI